MVHFQSQKLAWWWNEQMKKVDCSEKISLQEIAKAWGFKVKRTVFGQKKSKKKIVAAAKEMKSMKIADQLKLNKSETLKCLLA